MGHQVLPRQQVLLLQMLHLPVTPPATQLRLTLSQQAAVVDAEEAVKDFN